MRDRSRDGFRNKFEFAISTRFAPAWRLAGRFRWTQRYLNRLIVNTEINRSRVRPHPHTTLAPYTSWDSLTDRSWCARHLPARDAGDLPDLETVTELFRRAPGQARPSQKSTLLFPTFAQWVIDGFVRTRLADGLRSATNHDIDFSPLYGLSAPETAALRSYQGGELRSQSIDGQEYPPFLYEKDGSRIQSQFAALSPPAHLTPEVTSARRSKLFALGGDRANATPLTAAMGTLFLREHNRVCRQLRAARGDWNDERLFQTARNVLIVLLVKIAVEQYINHIAPCHFRFTLTPDVFWREPWYRPNWMTLEFNLAYRWHSMIPDSVKLGASDVPLAELRFHNQLLIHRGVGPTIDDCSRQAACDLGLFNTANGLLEIERKSIALGRAAQLGTYNDYRRAFRFPRLTSFEQITTDPEVRAALTSVYKSVDRLEFYPGLFAEDLRPHSAVPPLMERIVAIDAFSQAFTNPLLSEHVFNANTFSKTGMEIIHQTSSLQDVLDRNVPEAAGECLAMMTRQGQDRR